MKAPFVCQHIWYRWADVDGLRFAICKTCAHTWLEVTSP